MFHFNFVTEKDESMNSVVIYEVEAKGAFNSDSFTLIESE